MSLSAYIILSVALYITMIVIQAVVSLLQYGVGPLVGARDTLAEPNVLVGRTKRANQNMLEALGMFVPLALVSLHTSTFEATLGAVVFFWSRVAFVPLYLFGVPWLRTLVWFAGVAGLLMMIFKLLPLL